MDLLCFCSVSCLLCLFAHLFICALWSPAGKGLTSWLSFVLSNCEFVTFPLVSWVRCGTWLYRFLIFAPLLTFKNINMLCVVVFFLCSGEGDITGTVKTYHILWTARRYLRSLVPRGEFWRLPLLLSILLEMTKICLWMLAHTYFVDWNKIILKRWPWKWRKRDLWKFKCVPCNYAHVRETTVPIYCSIHSSIWKHWESILVSVELSQWHTISGWRET